MRPDLYVEYCLHGIQAPMYVWTICVVMFRNMKVFLSPVS